MTQNPFKPAERVAKKIKLLLYGPPGSGKTRVVLDFPRVAVIDSEGGTDLYGGRPGIKDFQVLRVKTLADIENAIRFIQEDKGKSLDTLAIDPITVLYDVQKNVESRNNTKDLSMLEWNRINGRMKALYNNLTMLPVHVVITAAESIEYSGEGLNLKKIGTKPDADKYVSRIPDFIIRMKADHSGVVEKSRGVALETTLTQVNWEVFAPIANAFADGNTLQLENDEEAAQREADDLRNKDVAASFITYWRSQSLNDTDVLTALGVKGLREWKAGRAAADKQVKSWLNTQLDTQSAS